MLWPRRVVRMISIKMDGMELVIIAYFCKMEVTRLVPYMLVKCSYQAHCNHLDLYLILVAIIWLSLVSSVHRVVNR